MKKVVMTIAAVLTLSVNTYAAPVKKTVKTVNDGEKLEMQVNMQSLSRTLGLDAEQQGDVDYIHNLYNEKVQKVAKMENEADRRKAVKKALMFNLANMREVLSTTQYRKYVMLLNTTLKNRGVENF